MNKITNYRFNKSFVILEKIQEYLIYLLPITLVTGSFLSDLSVSIIAMIFILILVISKKWHYILNKYFIFFSFWITYLIFRSLLSENPLLSLESSLFYWRFGLFSLAIWYLLDNNKKFKSNFFFITLVVVIFLSIDAFIQFVTGFNLLGFSYYTIDGQRISGMFGDEAILGNFISRILPILVALFLSFQKNSKIYSFASVLIILLSGFIILISGERTALLYFIIFMLIIMILVSNYRYEKIFTILFASIAIALILFSINSIKQRMFLNTIIETKIYRGFELKNMIPQSYKPIYETSLKMIIDKPIFGIGSKMFRESCNKEIYFIDGGCSTHPHNTYLQLLAETGIIGTIPIFFVFFYILYQYINHISVYILKNKILIQNNKLLFMSSIFISLFPFLPSLNFFHNWYSIMTFLPIGFLLHSITNDNLPKNLK